MNAPDNRKHGPWDTLWTHARLATMAAPTGCGIVEDGAIGIVGEKIAWVGPVNALPAPPHELARNVHHARHAWITPGLIDCHTHLIYAGSRADEFALRLQGVSYAEIAKAGGGILSTVKATRAASEEELLSAAAKRLRPLLREGVTAIEIKSGYGLDTATEIKMLRVARRLAQHHPVDIRTTFLGAHTLPPEYAGRADAYIDLLCNEMLPAIAKEGLADAVDAYCESIAFSPAQVEKLFAAAEKHRLPVKLHAEQLSDSNGAALAAKHKALSADHLEYANEAGIRAMAAAGTVAVLLPGAFYMLKEKKKPPVEQLRRHGVPIALATDCNPGTSPITSLLLMLNMGCILFGLTPDEALLGVTRHAAAALGLADRGTLEPGKRADMALWDIAHPAELAYHIGANPCRGVIRRGHYHTI